MIIRSFSKVLGLHVVLIECLGIWSIWPADFVIIQLLSIRVLWNSRLVILFEVPLLMEFLCCFGKIRSELGHNLRLWFYLLVKGEVVSSCEFSFVELNYREKVHDRLPIRAQIRYPFVILLHVVEQALRNPDHQFS